MIKIACTIGTTDKSVPLGLEIWLDQTHIFNLDHVKDTVQFEHIVDPAVGQHQLQFVMKNKTQAHTQTDSNNNIIKDACLNISDLTIDEFEIHNLNLLAVYQHNFNGAGPDTQSPFYQSMGCNGTLTLNFSVPVYDWLVKNWQFSV